MRSSPSTGIVAFACTTMLVACAGSTPEGPTDTDVHGAARAHVLQQVTASGIQGEERAAYEAATFSSGARCVPGAKEVYTCELEVTMALPGEDQVTQPLVIELVRRDGAWRVAP